MAKRARAYSRITGNALKMLGNLIAIQRRAKQMTSIELSERSGISRQTLSKIERGEPSVEIGIVFEAAAVVGVPLFQVTDSRELAGHVRRTDEQISLLPKRIRTSKPQTPDDNF